jgi:hypothetical protein
MWSSSIDHEVRQQAVFEDREANFWIHYYPVSSFSESSHRKSVEKGWSPPRFVMPRFAVVNGEGQVMAIADSLESAHRYGYTGKF